VSTYLHTIISFCQVARVWQTDRQTDVDSKVRSNEVRCAQKLDKGNREAEATAVASSKLTGMFWTNTNNDLYFFFDRVS